MKRAIVFCLAMVLTACGEPTVDTSDADAFEQSLDRMRESLSEDDLERFNAAVTLVMMNAATDGGETNGLAALSAMADLAAHPERMLDQAADQLDGRTASEIIVAGEGLTLQRLERQMGALQDSISTAEDALAEAISEHEVEAARTAHAQSILDQIELSRARYYWDTDRYRRKPIISFRVQNSSEVPVGRIFVHGRLETPGRSIPWVDEDFNYDIPGGLEPGEHQDLSLLPNSFGEWGEQTLRDRNDLVLSLTMVDIEGADGERLVGLDNTDFGYGTAVERRENRISDLRAGLETQRAQETQLAADIAELRVRLGMADEPNGDN